MREADVGEYLRARRIGKTVSQRAAERDAVARVQRNEMVRARLIRRGKRGIERQIIASQHLIDRDHLLSAFDPDHAGAADDRRVERIGEIETDRRQDVAAEASVRLHGKTLFDVGHERLGVDAEIVFKARDAEHEKRPRARIVAFEMAPLEIGPDERSAAAENALRRIVSFVLEPQLYEMEFRREQVAVRRARGAYTHRVHQLIIIKNVLDRINVAEIRIRSAAVRAHRDGTVIMRQAADPLRDRCRQRQALGPFGRGRRQA